MMEFLLRAGTPVIGKLIMDLNLPAGILIAVIQRGRRDLGPGGGEVLQEGDVISVVAMAETMPEAMRFFKVD